MAIGSAWGQSIRTASSPDDAIVISKIHAQPQGKILRLTFEITIADEALSSCEAFHIEPTVGNMPMPAISIEGYRYAKLSNTTAKHIRYNWHGMTLSYDEEIPLTKGRLHELQIIVERRSVCHSSERTTEINYTDSIVTHTKKLKKKKDTDANSAVKKSRKHQHSSNADGIDTLTFQVQGNAMFNTSIINPIDSTFNATLSKVINEFNAISEKPNTKIISVDVMVTSSPEGSVKYNTTLASYRANTVAQRIAEAAPQMASIAKILPVGENWGAFVEAVENSNLYNKEAILQIVSDNSNLDQREALLRQLPNFNQILAILQQTRACNFRIIYTQHN